MFTARVVFIGGLVLEVVLAPVLFYVVAFPKGPHHVVLASVATFVSLAITIPGNWLIYRHKRAQARRLDDSETLTGKHV